MTTIKKLLYLFGFTAIVTAILSVAAFAEVKTGKFGVYGKNDGTESALTWTYDGDAKFTVDGKTFDVGTLVISGTGKSWSYAPASVSYSSATKGWTYVGLPWNEVRQEIKTLVVATNTIESMPENAFAGLTSLKTVLMPANYKRWVATSIFNGTNNLKTLGIYGTEYVKGVIDLRSYEYINNEIALAWAAWTEAIIWLPEKCEYLHSNVTPDNKKSGILALTNNNTTHVTFVCVAGTTSEKIALNTKDNANNYHTNAKFKIDVLYDYTAPDILDEPESVRDTYNYSGAGATAEGKINQPGVVSVSWYFFKNTKTLLILSTAASGNYNETGAPGQADDQVGWTKYNDEIEHIVIGGGIARISNSAFIGMDHVKDIRLHKDVIKVAGTVFTNMVALTTIWRGDGPRVEGTADFSYFVDVNSGLMDTKIEKVILGPVIKTVSFKTPITLKTIAAYDVTASIDNYCKTNYIDLISLGHGEKLVGKYGIEIDLSLPKCGERVVYKFDKETGTLTLQGAGSTGDVANYFGGGSKNQWWFDIKNKIKKVVVEGKVNGIGKYAFCECVNLETVEIPAIDNFSIGNAAFQGCTNLKSIYRTGSKPIEGTLDLRGVKKLQPWTFAYDYLIANVITDNDVESIGSTTFDENTNLVALYGFAGGTAEDFAKSNNLQFFDSSKATPSPVTLEIPVKGEDTTVPGTEDTTGETAVVDTSATETVVTEPETTESVTAPEKEPANATPSEGMNTGLLIGIIAAACVVVAAVVVVFAIVSKKKKANKQ